MNRKTSRNCIDECIDHFHQVCFMRNTLLSMHSYLSFLISGFCTWNIVVVLRADESRVENDILLPPNKAHAHQQAEIT